MKLRLLISVIVFFLSGCSISGSKGRIGDLTDQLKALQDNPKVLLYAPGEMKQAEDALIQAVNKWNAGRRSESEQLANLAEEKIALTKKVTQENAALGLSDEAWSQRKWLIEVRNKRLSSGEVSK